MKYLGIIFLLLCEFTFGQIPGYPKFVGTRNFPTVYTLSYTLSADASSVDVTAQVINTGSIINETGDPTPTTLVSGILWGNSPPTITDGVSSKTIDGLINGQPFVSNITPLPDEGTIYIVAYAITAADTIYGKVLTIPQAVVRSPYTNKIWMDRNLGATALPITPQTSGDDASYGGLYQWGRKTDGHEIVLPRTGTVFFSATSNARPDSSLSAVPSNYFFILNSPNGNGDWLTKPKNSLWQGLNGGNNPCPATFRVPTLTEFTNETVNFTSQDRAGAFSSFLRLPVTGSRDSEGKPASYNYSLGRYWTSSIIFISPNNLSKYIYFAQGTNSLTSLNNGRINGMAVRCIKGEATSGGTAVISEITEGSLTGNLILDAPASGVTKTMYVNVTTAGSYKITTLTRNSNGVVFSGSGTFTSTGNNKSITLTATGTPTAQNAEGKWQYITNTDPSFVLDVPIVGEPSTNGKAIVSGYTSISSTGIMVVSAPVSNVTQTIRANVTRIGTYFLSTTTNNGIIFSANGTFSSLGNNDITLVATGTPNSVGDYSFTLNTSSPSFAFNRQVGNPSSGGTAEITWDADRSGLTAAQTTENNREIPRLTEASTYSPPFIHYLPVNVTQIGTYNIDAPGNRNFEGNTLRLVGSGTFTTTGVQTIPLYVYGAARSYTGNPQVGHYFYLPREGYSPTFYIVRNSK